MNNTFLILTHIYIVGSILSDSNWVSSIMAIMAIICFYYAFKDNALSTKGETQGETQGEKDE